jgi:hypothetical protein
MAIACFVLAAASDNFSSSGRTGKLPIIDLRKFSQRLSIPWVLRVFRIALVFTLSKNPSRSNSTTFRYLSILSKTDSQAVITLFPGRYACCSRGRSHGARYIVKNCDARVNAIRSASLGTPSGLYLPLSFFIYTRCMSIFGPELGVFSQSSSCLYILLYCVQYSITMFSGRSLYHVG